MKIQDGRQFWFFIILLHFSNNFDFVPKYEGCNFKIIEFNLLVSSFRLFLGILRILVFADLSNIIHTFIKFRSFGAL